MNLQKYKTHYTIFISIIFLLSVIVLKSNTTTPRERFVAYSGLAKTLTETKDAIEGFTRFINTISEITKGISKIAGFKVILLLISTLFFSAVFSFVGVPKGKASFLLALITVNSIWFIWEKSYNTESYDYIKTILKTNFTLLIPVIVFIVAKKILPVIYSKLKSLVFLRFNLFKKRGYNKKNVIETLKRYRDCSNEFEKSLIEDILNTKDERITLSGNTNKFLKEIDEIIKTIKI